MPTVTIDGQTYEFEGRPGLLQFCLEQGIELPHFCYHPAMSAPANCRQCLVEVGTPEIDRETRQPRLDEEGNPVIRYFPKLQTSCTMEVTDGMVVKSHRSSDLVERAQKDTLEMLLINHPLDCPICDQAGHCPLQIQAYKYGPEGSRFEFEKVSKPKQIDLGPRVMLDGERCINCTRCVRFTNEISKSHQLTIIERGVRNYPMTPPGFTFDEPYSMNVIDICPVGALTSKDFRFKARIWEMSRTASITVSGAKGNNCYYWVKDNQIMKITPRENPAVNEFWLPDVERLDYHRFNDNRPAGPAVGGVTGDWNTAYDAAASILKDADASRIVFLGSAHATVEDNYLLGRLAASLGADAPRYMAHADAGRGDNWLLTDETAPNANGCERLGMEQADAAWMAWRLESGVDVLYVLEDDPVAAGLVDAAALAGVKVILHAYNTTNQTLPHATVSLPAATAVETVGTYVNSDGHAQRVRPAKAIKGMNRTLMMEVGKSRADLHGTPFDKWFTESNMVDCQPGWVSLPAVAIRLGHGMDYRGPKFIMREVADSVDALSGATYEAMGELGVRLEDVATTA
ncbi:MAG: (2Fe-2S)-binding protein [Rhodothermales bacterium]|nr:(2Fe-2S)-binding protein [Rhodothermales bacterium]MBO6779104.1 (2Fe-2S)-binding protein [Rhodothermales bacterium]